MVNLAIRLSVALIFAPLCYCICLACRTGGLVGKLLISYAALENRGRMIESLHPATVVWILQKREVVFANGDHFWFTATRNFQRGGKARCFAVESISEEISIVEKQKGGVSVRLPVFLTTAGRMSFLIDL